MNGWLGQVTVQATDFSILFITIATVVTIRQRTAPTPPVSSLLDKLLISFGAWLIPLSTSATAFVLDDYKPVSGNWCWIDSKKPGLRYALAHGWRISIVFTTIFLYASLFVHIHRHFSVQRQIIAIKARNELSALEADAALENFFSGGTTGGICVYDEFVFMEERVDGPSQVWDEEICWEQQPTVVRIDSFTFPAVMETTIPQKADRTWSPPLSPCTAIRKEMQSEKEDENDDNICSGEDRRPSYGTTTSVASSSAPAMTSHPLSATLNSRSQITEISPLLRSPPTRDPLALVRRAPPQCQVSWANRQRQAPSQPQAEITTTITSQPAITHLSTLDLRAREARLQKILLLNAYPIAYVLLWIPGLLNRFVELLGYRSRTSSIAQASTQFIGLANALVYGYNERIWAKVGEKWRGGM